MTARRASGQPVTEPARAPAGGVTAMAVAGTLVLLTGQPWLFPSLGPTVMLAWCTLGT